MTSEEYLSELSSVSNSLNETYNKLSTLKNVNPDDKQTYLVKTSQLNEIGSLVESLIKVADKRGKLNIVSELIELVVDVFKKITLDMNSIISIAERETISGTTQEEALLKKMVDSLQQTGEIDPDLLISINETRNASLERYVVSILGDEAKNSKKYPWLYYLPTPDNTLDDLRKVDELIDTGSADEKFTINFKVLIKQVYLITKLNVRNLNMIRIADIRSTNEQLQKYQSILGKLLFSKVEDEFVPGEYDDLYSNYGSHTTSLKNLLGNDLYKRFVFHIIEDGKNFGPSKTVKTETLLKYILIATKKITPSHVGIYKQFYEAVVDTINRVITANKNITQLDIVVSKKSGDVDKDRLRRLHNSKSNIFTYVKIRSDDPDNTNDRYRVSLDRDRQVMYMGYEPSPESVYEQNTSPFKLKDKFKHLRDPNEPYSHNYLFGPFTYIFKTRYGNKEISEHDSMKPLLDKLINGESVCIVGYGASGSGKTTTLVYASFEKEKERRDGILINFCNKLGAQKHYDNIEVSFVELEGDIHEGDEYRASENYKILPIPEKQKNSSKYTEADKERSKYYTPRVFTYNNDWKYNDSSKNKLKEYDSQTNLGEFIVGVMDSKRSIAATTNNPISSRSHMIIFVRLRKSVDGGFDDKQPYLVICDFAGVENKFECSNPAVREAFKIIKSTTKCKKFTEGEVSQLKRDTGASKDFCEPFYEDYINNKVDPFIKATKRELPPTPTIAKEVDTNAIDKLIGSPVDKVRVNVHKSILQTMRSIVEKLIKKKPDGRIVVQPNPTINIDTKELAKKLLEAGKSIYGEGQLLGPFGSIWRLKASEINKNPQKLDFLKYGDKVKDVPSRMLNNIDEIIRYMEWRLTMSNYEKEKKVAQQDLEKAKDDVLSEICNDRVKEGQFINDSLEQLRIFISHFITRVQNKDSTVLNPKFIDACVPIQCNPNYEDCFGSSLDSNERKRDIKSSIATQIRQKLCENEDNCGSFSNMTFCVFNVINLSQKVNNPPPVPYIDISNLVNEQIRLESLDETMVSDEFKINDDRTSTLVYKPYLEEIRDSPLLDPNTEFGTIKGQMREDILSLIYTLLEPHKDDVVPGSADVTLADLGKLVSYINKINSLSVIGTMEFTDMIAKFGLNRKVCNYKYKPQKSSSVDSGSKVSDVYSTLDDYKKYITSLSRSLYDESITR